MRKKARRFSYVFLGLFFLLAVAFAAVRPLRVPGVYSVIGAVLFISLVIAAWVLGARATRTGTESEQRLAWAGGFLIVPFALIALYWVGLGPPWAATPPENVMRYFVLLASSIAVTLGFLMLKESLSEAGERTFSTVGSAAAILAGCAYLVWMCFMIGDFVGQVRDGHAPPAIVGLNDVLDVLLDVACLLTYLATAAFAASLGRSGWFGRYATRAYVVLSLFASLCLVLRGISFPDPTSLSTAWYTQPGFIAGIPAIPFIMPYLLGVLLLRRAGDRSGAS